MKALTVWQPWASLIVWGVKPYEFRSWPAPKWVQGRRIAVHAGARAVRPPEIADLILRLKNPKEAWTTALKPQALEFLEKAFTSPGMLPTSAVVGTALLGKPVHSTEIVAEFGGPVNDSDRDEHSNWAWPLTEIMPMVPPEPAKGAQGFWNWNGPVS